MEKKILELEKKLQDMKLKYDNLFEIVEELNYYFLKEMSEPSESIYSVGGYSWTPLIIPRNNSKYLKSGSGGYYYVDKNGNKYFERGLSVDNIKKGLQYISSLDIIKGIKKAGVVGCLAPKHLWSLYDKIEKLKKQEKNKIVKKRVERFTEIADKIQSKKESIKKRKKELREKIRKTETEAGAELRLMQKELDKYERED